MAYLAPIHRPSSVRHALKLKFLAPEEDCLVVAKANRLEFYTETADGLSLQHSKAIYGKVTMLQKLRPALSPTDHLFIGTDRFMYFTLSWNAEKKQLQTEKTFESVADNAARESQTGERCHVDPTGRFMTVEVYEGIITVIPLVQRGKKRKQESDIAHMGDPQPCRLSEMFVRSSAFLRPRSPDEKPKLALLYEDTHSQVKLKMRELAFSGGDQVELDEGEQYRGDLELGSSHLIPLEEPTYGLIVIGETSIGYYSEETGELQTEPLEEATIFVAWEKVDGQRFIFADDYGRLYLFTLVLDSRGRMQTWKLDTIGQTSRASVLVHLSTGQVFVGSHQGDSQVIRIADNSLEIVQTFSNIAPVLDFTVMDMGNRSGEGQTNEYSSGQARIVTGSGAYQDGSLRSVRSGVGLEDLGVLGEMEHISNLFSLKSDVSSEHVDTLLVTSFNESRVFRFDSQGEVEEVEEFAGLALSETTLAASNVSQGRIVQVTNGRVRITELDGGMIVSEWLPQGGQTITAASTNDTHVLVSLGGVTLYALSIDDTLRVVQEKTYAADSQVACVALPPTSGNICFLGFWQNSQLSICSLGTLKALNTVQISDESVPRSLLLTQIFPDQPPTLFAAMADGNVVTYSFNPSNNELSGKKSIILGTRQANFRALPRGNGLFNVFATCEHPSLIYSSEGRLVYSAVTAENATTVCPFDTEAYPGSVAIATSEDLRIALVDTERTTHVQTLKVDETVRRISYSPSLKAFGLGTIKRILKGGEEILLSHFKLVDEIQFKELDTYPLNEEELVESVMHCELPDGSGGLSERFVIGTAYLDDQNATAQRGRILVLEVTEDRVLKLITEIAVKGGCRCLAMCEGKIVAALIKTIVIYNVEYRSASKPDLIKAASFRCSTAPIDITVNKSLITIADLMKSAVVLEYKPGESGIADTLTEVARHFQTTWATAVAEVDVNTYLESDAEGNLAVLYRDPNGVTEDDKRRLGVSSEMLLGEMVNRIRRIDIATAPDAVVIPRAFMGTVEGSIYLFGLISPNYQNLLMTLQSNLAELVHAPGDVPFAKYRAFKNQVREAEEPYRFVDGDLVERFLDVSEEVQNKAVEGLGVDVESVRAMVEVLRRMH
ncbi:mono-functional DNA-alkylating methyl methanesulfonate N-term-domain-containing protein [Massariosphaeria phaeospora]|uniref:DNA damage-binding protein 1 n=1 Tax=Massariosphaeria phaeospora TaxID=100035 RepID=A0A7C8IAG1_9PLEO|nr:mono-functional DNA-alkylating methyl methanesulfonate N-term-domain-containing protein [Massariosphaeria phaeospora]